MEQLALGSPFIYNIAKTGERYRVPVNFSPFDADLLQLAINTEGTLNRDIPLTFGLSQMLNSAGVLVEQYSFAKGCQCDSITIAGTNEAVTVTSEWVALNVTDPSLTHGLAGTPTWEALDVATMVPYTGLSGGIDPLEWDENAQKVRGYSVTVNNAIDEVQFIGDANLSYASPTTHRGTITMDIVYKDTAIMADVRTLTKRQASIKLGPNVWFNATGVVLESYDKPLSASSTEAFTISYSGKFLKGEIVTTDPSP